jgi:hypothetical protein
MTEITLILLICVLISERHRLSTRILSLEKDLSALKSDATSRLSSFSLGGK